MSVDMRTSVLGADNVGALNSQSGESLQKKLFDRVSQLLSDAGISIDGQGSLALDIDNNGDIVVIGDIQNKDEIAKVLNDDEELKALLLSGQSNESGQAKPPAWSQQAYEVQISDSYTKSAGSQGSTTPAESALLSAEGSTNTFTSEITQTAQFEIAYENLIEEQEKNRPVSIKPGNLHKILGLNSQTDDRQTILGELSARITKQRDEVNSQIDSILGKLGISLGDEEEFDFGLDENGQILVKTASNSERVKKRAEQIQQALRENDEQNEGELSHSIKRLAMDELAFAEISDDNKKEDTFSISDSLTAMYLEESLGQPISSMFDKNGEIDLSNNALSKLKEKNPELLAIISDTGMQHPEKLDARMTLTINGLSSESATQAVESHKDMLAEHVTDMAYEYNDPGVYNQDVIKGKRLDSYLRPEIDPATSKRAGELAEQKNGRTAILTPPPELRIEHIDATIDKNGTVKVETAINALGEEMSPIMKDVAAGFFTTGVSEISGYLSMLSESVVEEHDTEHGDTDIYKHELKLSWDYNTGRIDYDVVSEQADKQAQKELDNALGSLNEEINQYLVEEKDIAQPVQIDVDEEGKLVADTSALDATEAKIVTDSLKILGDLVAEADTTEVQADTALSKTEVEPEEEDSTDYAKEKKQEKLGKLTQKLQLQEDEINGVEDSEEPEIEFSLEGLDEQTMLGKIRNRVPKGLRGAFDIALKLDSILDKFHN